jgi:acetyl-CoA carboxylase beta subunit
MASGLYLEIAQLAFIVLPELNTQIQNQEIQMEECAPLGNSARLEHQQNRHAQQESIVCMKGIIKKQPIVMMDIDALVVTLYQIHILQKC